MEIKNALGVFLAAACCAVALSTPAAAQAGTSSTYAPSSESRMFVSSDGGWTDSTSQTGLCVTSVTCPAIADSFQASGGAGGPGDGFIQTSESGLLSAGIAAISSGTYESPSFAYNGAGGQMPDQVHFSLDRNSNVSALLAVTGASAEYTVQLIDRSGGPNLTVVDHRALAATGGWSADPTTNIDPDQLTIGHAYSIRITSSFATPATVLPSGSAGYDNVVLSALSNGSGNGGGGNGGNGGGSGNGSNGAGPGAFASGIAVLFHNRVYIHVKCVHRSKPRCAVNSAAVTKRRRGKATTRVTRSKIKAGKTRLVMMRVRPASVARLQSAHKVLVRERSTTKGNSRMSYKHLKLIRR